MSLWLLLVWPAEAFFALGVLFFVGWWEERDTRRRIAEDDEVQRLDAVFALQSPDRP